VADFLDKLLEEMDKDDEEEKKEEPEAPAPEPEPEAPEVAAAPPKVAKKSTKVRKKVVKPGTGPKLPAETVVPEPAVQAAAEEETPAEPDIEEEPEEEKWACPTCGAEVTPGIDECPNCGQVFGISEEGVAEADRLMEEGLIEDVEGEELPAPMHEVDERMLLHEQRIRLNIRVGLIFTFGFLLIYTVYKTWWEQDFYRLNFLPLVTLGLVAAAGLTLFVVDLRFEKLFSIRTLLTLMSVGIIVTATVLLVFFPREDLGGLFLGFLGFTGFLLLLLSRVEIAVKSLIASLMVIIGLILIILTPLNMAFGISSVAPGQYAEDSLVFGPLSIVGLVMTIIGGIFLMKWTKQKSKTMLYFGFFMFGLACILLVPLHESIGLYTSGFYGQYDNSLILGGVIGVLLSAVMFMDKRREDASITLSIATGDKLLKSGEYIEALQEYEKAIEINEKHAGAWCNKGAALRRLGRYEEALQCFDTAIALKPTYEDAWVNKGNTLKNLHQYRRASECYNKVIELNPDYEVGWSNKGSLMMETGNLQKAMEYFNKALQLNERFLDAWVGKGNVLRLMGKYNEEIKCYDKALSYIDDHLPAYLPALLSKGNALASIGKYHDAIELYDKVLSIDHENSDALNNRGLAAFQLEHYDEALDMFDNALEADKDNDTAWANRGLVLSILDRQDEAFDSFETALLLNEFNEAALVYEGDLLVQLERYERADWCYQKAINFNPNNALAWKARGDLMAKLGHSEESTKCYQRAEEVTARSGRRAPVVHREAVVEKPTAAELPTAAAPTPAAAPIAPEAVAAPVAPAAPVVTEEEKVAAEGADMRVKLQRGYNYLIFEEATLETYEMFRGVLADGIPGICITTTFPTKLKRQYDLAEARIFWLSEADSKVESFRPKRLDFEITRTINDFIKTNEESCLLLDGFEYLVLENGFENVMKFIKKVNDLASMSNATVIVPINPNAFSREEMTVLTKEFDRTEKR